jgi:hypothetical protein
LALKIRKTAMTGRRSCLFWLQLHEWRQEEDDRRGGREVKKVNVAGTEVSWKRASMNVPNRGAKGRATTGRRAAPSMVSTEIDASKAPRKEPDGQQANDETAGQRCDQIHLGRSFRQATAKSMTAKTCSYFRPVARMV